MRAVGEGCLLPVRIISGGQTGADRAGLDAARSRGLLTGGQAPSQYMTERGPDPSLAQLGLTAGGTTAERTAANVAVADATVVFMTHASSGSDLTIATASALARPFLVIDPWAGNAADLVIVFLRLYQPRVLNVAGHRESVATGIYARVVEVLLNVLDTLDVMCVNERHG